jgi:hypothetical protein
MNTLPQKAPFDLNFQYLSWILVFLGSVGHAVYETL